MERDNSSNNGSQFGGWRRRRRRRRKRRKKRNTIQPILGPVLSGMGFGPLKHGGVGSRRGSESSILSKASAQGIRMQVDNPAFRGSLSSLHDRLGGGVSGSDLKGPASRSRRRKLPRLAPLSKHRHRSLSSSRSSLSQLGLGMGLHGGMHPAFSPSHFPQQNPYAQLYGSYADYAQFYASMGYPPMGYPYWPPYPYPHFPPQAPPPPPPGASPSPGTAPGSTAGGAPTDFSIFNANNSSSHPGATSSPEMERKRVVTASTSRRSEVTIETQQTEMISMQKLKTGSDYKKQAQPVSDDDSIEDLNSSELEDSAAEEAEDGEGEEENEDNDNENEDSTEEAEDEV